MFSLLSPLTRDFLRPIVPELLLDLNSAAREMERWMPSVDIHEDDHAVHFEVEVPGMKPKDLQINVKDGVLTVAGERQEEQTHKEHGRVRRVERMSGSFVRRFTLPSNAETKDVQAALKNGVLKVSIPKKAMSEPREGSVPIRVDEDKEGKSAASDEHEGSGSETANATTEAGSSGATAQASGAAAGKGAKVKA
jgi:HSP20 family protein